MFTIITNGTRARNINKEEGVANEFHNDDIDVYILYRDGQRIMIPDMESTNIFFEDEEFARNNYLMIEVNHKLRLIRLMKRSRAFDELYAEELDKGSLEAHPAEYAGFFEDIHEFLEGLKQQFVLDYTVFICKEE